jgi:site-specific recombinase XerD
MQKNNAAFRKTRLRTVTRQRPHIHSLNQPVSQQVIQTLATGISDLRDRAIILILADTGARVSEIIQLNRDDIKVGAGTIGAGFMFAPVGTLSFLMKGNRPRKLYLSARALEALDAYLETREDSNAALFIRGGERITAQTVRRLLHVWCDRLGVARFPTHDFRGRFAENLLLAQASVHTVATMLGYSVPTVPHMPTIHLNLVTFDGHGSAGASDQEAD